MISTIHLQIGESFETVVGECVVENMSHRSNLKHNDYLTHFFIIITRDIYQLLDEVEQNIVICWWRADQLFAVAEARVFATTEFNNCFVMEFED